MKEQLREARKKKRSIRRKITANPDTDVSAMVTLDRVTKLQVAIPNVKSLEGKKYLRAERVLHCKHRSAIFTRNISDVE